MASLSRYLEDWRGYFGSSGSNIFEVIEAAFPVASSDCPGELLHHKKSIAKLLQVGCSNRPEEMELLVFTNINNRYMHKLAAAKEREIIDQRKPNNDASWKPAAATEEPAPAAQEKMEMNEPAKRSIKIKVRLGSKLAPKEPSPAAAVPLIKPCKPSGAAPLINPCKPSVDAVPLIKPCKPSDGVPLIKPCKPSDDGTRLESAKRKLREGYQQAEKRRRIQVLSSHHLPNLVTDEVPASKPRAPAAAVPMIIPSKKLETAKRKLYAEGVKKRRMQQNQQPKRNCARPRADQAEAKRTRESEREAARQALLKVVKTVEINENSLSLEDQEMLRSIPGVGDFRLGGTNPLEQLGLYLKVDDENSEPNNN